MNKSFTRMCYGERFPLRVADAKPQPVKKPGDDINKKLERILSMMEQMLAGVNKKQTDEKQERFNRACAEAEQGYSDRNPHIRRDENRLSIPVENQEVPTRKVKDTAIRSNYDRMCAEAAAAYAARNPHKRG